jgi:HEAT repeat protein
VAKLQRGRSWARGIFAALFLVSLGAARPASADDPYASAKQAALDPKVDFVVRVGAALRLGKSGDPSVRPVLEQALRDVHPAVRSAAAAGLLALGDKAAIPALERQEAAESAPGVKTQLTTAIQKLRVGDVPTAPGIGGAQIVLQLGTMRNATPVRGAELERVLRSVTRSKAKTLPKVVVVDVSETALLKEAQDKRVPVLALDGTIVRLAQTQNSGTVSLKAEVEFVVRRTPEHQLKGTLSGSATAFESARAMGSASKMAAMQDQAIEGAVESALKGADQMVVAAR